MTKQTVLYEQHVADGARMVDFHGWLMPLNYGSQLEEHHAVRRDAGMFDVSHMTIVDLHGPNVRAFLRHLLANDVARLTQPGKALYSAMLNASGGYRRSDRLLPGGELFPFGGQLRHARAIWPGSASICPRSASSYGFVTIWR